MYSSKDFEKAWGEILARSWRDNSYRKKVEENPAHALEEMGINVPNYINLSVKPTEVSSDQSIVVLPWPSKPEADSKTGLVSYAPVASGNCCCSVVCCCP